LPPAVARQTVSEVLRKVLSRAHVNELYENVDLEDKKKLLSSIFPEKLYFDGKKCRTPRMNEVLRLVLLTDEASKKKKTGQNTSKSTLSRQVERMGVEPMTFRLPV
jgi:site-specific DNA recombinase